MQPDTDTFELIEEDSVPVTGATVANPVVITSEAHGFSNDDITYIFNTLGMTELDGNRYKVASKTDDTFELTHYSTGVDTDGSGFSAWTAGGRIHLQVDGSAFDAYISGGKVRKAVTSITGLDHLEGKNVQILANGSVIPSVTVAESTTAAPTTVVVGGAITLATAASRVHAGLRYIADLETLNIEQRSSTRATLQGEKSKVSSVVVRFEDSILPLVGPTSDDLLPMVQRQDEGMGAPTALLTGDKGVTISPSWNSNGRMFFRQDQPVPTTWLAIIPDIDIEDG